MEADLNRLQKESDMLTGRVDDPAVQRPQTVPRIFRDERITEAACWAHARSKIHNVHVRTPSALNRIGELYTAEAEIRGMPSEQRLAERQMKTLSRHSELAEAFTYVLNQWQALMYYADNNIAENALRMVSLGRKNFL